MNKKLKNNGATLISPDELNQVIIENMPLGVQCWDEECQIISCNEGIVRLFGLNSKQEYIDHFYELSPEYQPNGQLSRELALKNVKKAFAKGSWRFEWTHVNLSGEIIPVEINMERTFYKNRPIVIGYTIDLREVKTAIAKMREADERTQIMLDAVPLCANFLNKNLKNIDCNQAAVKLFELSDKKEYLSRFYELSPPYQPCGRSSRKMARDFARKAFTEGYCRFEWVHQKLNGELVPSEITLVRVKYKDDFIVAGYTRDLRELKATLREMHKAEADLRLARDMAEESIRLKDEFLSKMSHGMRTLMIVTNDKTEIEYISNSLAEWFNLDNMQHALNRPLWELPFSDEMKLMLQEVMENEEYVQKNFELTINNKKYWFMLRSSMIGDNKTARVFEWVDITSLVEAKNEAEIATKAKNDFLAKMSHEIRTPMNAIMGMSELILREHVPPTIQEHAASIKQASASLLSLINDILDFSKIESGKLELVSSEYLFASLLNDVVSIIRMRIIEKPIRFIVNVDHKLPHRLIGDEIRFRQILLNLLSNAVKYTEKGFISIVINGSFVAGDTVFLTIEISDSGIGIKEEDINKLFENFIQLDVIKNQRIQGTGLGLAISKSLCLAMGGNISVRSKYGEGSTFTITIPQKVAGYKRLAYVKNPDKKSVLIYEPRTVYAQSIARTLGNLKVACTMVTNHSDFYNELQHNSFNFVFIASFLWENSGNIIEIVGSSTKWVLLAEFWEDALPTRNVRKITMPAHVISIANVLNNVTDDVNYIGSHETTALFVAPSAKVLIVDDIRTNLKVAEGLMAPYKMQIDTCLSGPEAIRMAQENKYDIIFMDHMMPQMDGVEASSIIRGLEDGSGYYQNVPIVALTANAVAGMREMFLKNGLNDFLPKPIEPLRLTNILGKWIPKEKQQKYEKEVKATNVLPDFEIKGINVKDGLFMTGGAFDNYIKILGFFYNEGLRKPAEIRECLAQNNLKLYTIYVHAIKSSAATIGAAEMCELAKKLEIAGNENDIAFIMENNEKFLTQFETLLQNINNATAKYQLKAEPDGKADLEVLKANLPKLSTAFKEMNIREIDNILTELDAKKWNKKIADAIKSMAQDTLLSDYDKALNTIEELLAFLKNR